MDQILTTSQKPTIQPAYLLSQVCASDIVFLKKHGLRAFYLRHLEKSGKPVCYDLPIDRANATELFEMVRSPMEHIFNDGGREAAGFKGRTGDCVVRAIAIISGLPYRQIYDDLFTMQSAQRKTKRLLKDARYIRNGTYVKRKWFKDYMRELGFIWTPTMQIGQGCKVHLQADELPAGKIIVSLSRHYCAVIDGVIHDTYDPNDREAPWWDDQPKPEDWKAGPRCVYGYWSRA